MSRRQPSGHYFSADPSVPSKPGEVVLSLPDFTASLAVDRGVFSTGAVDTGTLELLRAAPPPPATGNLLDLGCGYGPIACALAHRSPGATVWAVDVNERAVDLTVRNAERLGLTGVRATTPDGVPESLGFDGIWSNPPIRIGKAALHELLTAWIGRLLPGASAWLVVQRHLGSDSLSDWLASNGNVVDRIASKKGYRILRVTPS